MPVTITISPSDVAAISSGVLKSSWFLKSMMWSDQRKSNTRHRVERRAVTTPVSWAT
jgi:hypothetical protein